ncbi:hypothetical protein [Streptomyces mobaraensis]|uniref:Uncharacterized protein n=1 Tax=Streptomyces mobaraensis TaxID=35621 RepID=A0A5N5W311_STRMB|nr:hypothetical protein [Streptomyces mobaraensis]KAB7835746.1 hypothetical protein FRZ00_26360 [Streptomyces mobaraensis]
MRPTGKAPIVELLARARVLDSAFDDYDADAALARIATRVVRERADSLDWRARTVRDEHDPHHRAPAGVPPRGVRAALHTHAAFELGLLCSLVIRDHQAIAAIALLVDDPARIDPRGALAFACLLHLADREEGAAFWWQFAAGADSTTAAHCLYLHHLQHSDRGLAEHWHHQATTLHTTHDGTDDDWPLPHPPRRVRGDEPPSRYPAPGRAHTLTELALRQAVARERWRLFAHHLTDLLRGLETTGDADFGTVPRPGPYLAARIEQCLTTAR